MRAPVAAPWLTPVCVCTELDLFANLRPIVSVPTKLTLPGLRKEVNMLIVRENTECLMVGKETMDEAKGKAVAERVITRTASERVARTAFLQAKTRFLQAQEALEHQSKFTASALTLRCAADTRTRSAHMHTRYAALV